ncbi:MAG: adaptor protein MecA [Oscillospiraceae bacterium]|jgi:negative regulator of genetic competence, sporulation and motility|nr:adaptor protein MecA [Oscillospiraceae bacterium]
MIIEQLDRHKVLISLCNRDMDDFALNFDDMSFADPHAKKILLRLLTLACRKAGIETKNKRLVVEALPHDLGCLILMTLESTAKTSPKVYRLKQAATDYCFAFENSEDFFESVKMLYESGSDYIETSAIAMDGKFYLILTAFKLPKNIVAILREFGSQTGFNSMFKAKLFEAGTLLAGKNAITQIGKAFAKKK